MSFYYNYVIRAYFSSSNSLFFIFYIMIFYFYKKSLILEYKNKGFCDEDRIIIQNPVTPLIS